MSRRKLAAIPAPTALPDVTAADIASVKALARGDASAEQQKRALDWIIRKDCAIGEVSFHPGDPYATAFKDGRRFPGLVLAKLVTEPMQALRREFGLPAEDQMSSRPPKE